jgi:hypothetical protein
MATSPPLDKKGGAETPKLRTDTTTPIARREKSNLWRSMATNKNQNTSEDCFDRVVKRALSAASTRCGNMEPLIQQSRDTTTWGNTVEKSKTTEHRCEVFWRAIPGDFVKRASSRSTRQCSRERLLQCCRRVQETRMPWKTRSDREGFFSYYISDQFLLAVLIMRVLFDFYMRELHLDTVESLRASSWPNIGCRLLSIPASGLSSGHPTQKKILVVVRGISGIIFENLRVSLIFLNFKWI